MTKEILFMTGNGRKIREAEYICQQYGFKLKTQDNDVDEIQHIDPAAVTKAKARAAYGVIGRPLLVQDTSWSIPALGGFPGAYMKDVATWISAEDWLQMMRRHDDRSVLQHEHMVFHDGQDVYHFEATYAGRFIDESRGEGIGLSSDQVIMMGKSTQTLAEALDAGVVSSQGDAGLEHWRKFAEWYSQR